MTEALATTVIAVSALLAMVLLTRRAVARHFGPRAAYALWLLPAARLFMPSISLPSGWFPNLTPAIQSSPPMPAGVWRAVAVPPDTPSAFVTAAETPDIIVPVLIAIWTAGVVIGLIWALRSQRLQARHVRQTTVMVPDELRGDIERAARLSGLPKIPNVRLSIQNDGPLVGGLIRPIIVLPKDFMTQFTPTQRRLALLHEMTHLRRGDLWAATAMLAFRLVSWPNPLIHWAWPRFRADQEAACDASVLRRIGETARADYAETLLTAAKTDIKTTGRAARVPGTGLTLSLHHPIKERLMTLGSNTNKKHGATRWALGAMLLAGTALTAPLSMADDQAAPTPPTAESPSKPTITTQKTMHIVVRNDEDGKGYEIREDNGVKTYLRVSKDGTTEKLSKEELEAEYDIDVDAMIKPPHPPFPPRLDGEPGLRAMVAPHMPGGTHETIIIRKSDDAEGGTYEIEIENDVKRAFRIDEDGTKTEVTIDEIGDIADIDVEVMGGAHAFAFPALPDGQKRRFLNSDEDVRVWIDGDKKHEQVFSFFNSSGNAGTEAQMRSAQSMIAASDRLIKDLREEADGAADKDLRNAERELEKARKALDKAMEAVRKSEQR